jgi:ABC-type lipoprotein export system ATPase subunit
MDEPTAALDSIAKKVFWEDLGVRKRQNFPWIFVVTHDEVPFELKSNVVVVEDGIARYRSE